RPAAPPAPPRGRPLRRRRGRGRHGRGRRRPRHRLARLRLRQGERAAARGAARGGAGGADRGRGRGDARPRGGGPPRRRRRPPLHQPTLPTEARRAADHPGGLMATLVTKKKGSDRWLGEVKGILALAGAGFGLVALATFEAALPPAVQTSPVGPVGGRLGWGGV